MSWRVKRWVAIGRQVRFHIHRIVVQVLERLVTVDVEARHPKRARAMTGGKMITIVSTHVRVHAERAAASWARKRFSAGVGIQMDR